MAFELKNWVGVVFGQADLSGRRNVEHLEGICGPDKRTLARLVKVFENPATYLNPYSNEVLEKAFFDLDLKVFAGVFDTAIDWDLRHRVIRSFQILFRTFFAMRCTPTLGHLSEQGNALNTICYMWWDLDNWMMDRWNERPDTPSRRAFDAACLESMRSILTIDHLACQESAIHGLGHFHKRRGAAVENIIDEYLTSARHPDERLREYALRARRGRVL